MLINPGTINMVCPPNSGAAILDTCLKQIMSNLISNKNNNTIEKQKFINQRLIDFYNDNGCVTQGNTYSEFRNSGVLTQIQAINSCIAKYRPLLQITNDNILLADNYLSDVNNKISVIQKQIDTLHSSVEYLKIVAGGYKSGNTSSIDSVVDKKALAIKYIVIGIAVLLFILFAMFLIKKITKPVK